MKSFRPARPGRWRPINNLSNRRDPLGEAEVIIWQDDIKPHIVKSSWAHSKKL